jgi:hypothetical protein
VDVIDDAVAQQVSGLVEKLQGLPDIMLGCTKAESLQEVS